MELDITEFFTNAAPMDYSASAMEFGQDVGAITWRHACEDSPDYMMLDTDEKRDDFRRYAKGFGAWTEEEIAAWSDIELNALCIQMIAGDIREAGLMADSDDTDWQEYENGENAHTLWRAADGKIYYSIGE